MNNEVNQLAFELGGLEDGSYHLEQDDLELVVKTAIEPYNDVLRSLASWLGAGGYNAPEVDPEEFEAKIRWGVDNLIKCTLDFEKKKEYYASVRTDNYKASQAISDFERKSANDDTA